MKIVLVSAPYRKPNVLDKLAQLEHVDELCGVIVVLGALPIAAHCNSRSHEGLQPGEWWMAAYGTLLKRCDAVYFDADWSESVGCQFEHRLAQLESKPMLFSIPALKAWLEASR